MRVKFSAVKKEAKMAMIYVKTRAGRKAYVEGRAVPHDEFVPVVDDHYTRRLIHVWEDLELQDGNTPTPKRAPSQAKD
jgi:hypothetical protein